MTQAEASRGDENLTLPREQADDQQQHRADKCQSDQYGQIHA
jgi:hypothetical protein